MINSVIKSRRGFTLIELISTIALLAVISTISVVSVNKVIQESKVTDCNSLFDNINGATKEYFSDYRYNLSEISKYLVNNSYYNITADELVGKNYLSAPIINPFTDNEMYSDRIGINVWLKDDYTVKKVEIVNSSNEKISCDNKTTLSVIDIDSSALSGSTSSDLDDDTSDGGSSNITESDSDIDTDLGGDDNVLENKPIIDNNIDINITKTVVYENRFPSDAYCAQAIDEFYSENGTTYYFTCQMSQYIYVIVNGVEYGLVDALESGVVTISEVEEAKGSEFLSKSTNLSAY